ncbi:hypothetical protein EZV73_07390 [Acidaminobacter sp. JC074]|uniref:hypothetical protein n=1 Tax=Acidaminobacter sp. JC074 TaxID=2530199 RepID=UPI001F0E4469|nr:hypothetical protein [Acidaminobacter sp. JC074]MCH4887388.1 hypothetical protein [Acidaminobacter sp. JC074]
MSDYNNGYLYRNKESEKESSTANPKDQSIGFVKTLLRVILAIVVLGPVVVYNATISDLLGVFLIILYGVLFYISGIILPDENDVWND